MVTRFSTVSNASLQRCLADAELPRPLCAALAHPHRIRLACIASRNSGLSHSHLSALLDVPLPLLAYHARQLGVVGLLRDEIEGRTRRICMDASSRAFIECLLDVSRTFSGARR